MLSFYFVKFANIAFDEEDFSRKFRNAIKEAISCDTIVIKIELSLKTFKGLLSLSLPFIQTIKKLTFLTKS